MPAGSSVLTIEFKVNLLAPAKGTSFLAKGLVVKPGKATMMTLQGRPGVAEG
jgi:acyl-coenzyme A thioesterase PaaI-like protein